MVSVTSSQEDETHGSSAWPMSYNLGSQRPRLPCQEKAGRRGMAWHDQHLFRHSGPGDARKVQGVQRPTWYSFRSGALCWSRIAVLIVEKSVFGRTWCPFARFDEVPFLYQTVGPTSGDQSSPVAFGEDANRRDVKSLGPRHRTSTLTCAAAFCTPLKPLQHILLVIWSALK